MKRNILIAIVFIFLIYFLSYIWIRHTNTEIWEKDGRAYVIFPDDKKYLYYFYRPLSYFDATLTGMRFHIGQHR